MLYTFTGTGAHIYNWTVDENRLQIASATTLVSVRNTQVFRMALTALTERCAL